MSYTKEKTKNCTPQENDSKNKTFIRFQTHNCKQKTSFQK